MSKLDSKRNSFVAVLKNNEDKKEHLKKLQTMDGKLRDIGLHSLSDLNFDTSLREIPTYKKCSFVLEGLSEEFTLLCRRYYELVSPMDVVSCATEDLKKILTKSFPWISYNIQKFKNYQSPFSIETTCSLYDFVLYLKRQNLRDTSIDESDPEWSDDVYRMLGFEKNDQNRQCIIQLMKDIQEVNRIRNNIIHCLYTDDFERASHLNEESCTNTVSMRKYFLTKMSHILRTVQNAFQNPVIKPV